MELVGPHFGIYGVIDTGTHTACKMQADMLVPMLWLVNQSNDLNAMTRIMKTFKALKNALVKLRGYYDLTPTKSVYPLTFRQPLSYLSEVKRNVYRAVHNGGVNVIVKFVTRYGEDVHKFCSENGFAPELLFCKQVTLQYIMIIMKEVKGVTVTEYLQQNENNDSVKVDVKNQCDKILKIMHASKYCHGDFRPSNLIVDESCKLFVIDFDWSGKAGLTKYPYFMNHCGIDWTDGANDGQLLQPDHDTH